MLCSAIPNALSSVPQSTIALFFFFFQKCIQTLEAYNDGCKFGAQEFSHRRMDR